MTTPPNGELWIDPLWEYVATGVMGLEHLGTNPTTGVPVFRVRGPRITMCCTRGCGATPSRGEADIVAAARLCLEAGLTEFRLPD